MFFIDDYKHPTNSVSYVKESILGPGVDPADYYSWFKTTCACSLNEQCVDNGCICVKYTGKNYISSFLSLDKLQNATIYECGAFCSCNFTSCHNRLVQKGPNPRLEVRQTRNKGYGLFTLETIAAGTFICEYAGELISKDVAVCRCRDKDNAKYVLTLREHYGESVIESFIDAYKSSNIGRYVNHSCSPNCIIVPARTGCIIPRAAIFTMECVNNDEELTYSYGEGEACEFGRGFSPCHCESRDCKGFLPCHTMPAVTSNLKTAVVSCRPEDSSNFIFKVAFDFAQKGLTVCILSTGSVYGEIIVGSEYMSYPEILRQVHYRYLKSTEEVIRWCHEIHCLQKKPCVVLVQLDKFAQSEEFQTISVIAALTNAMTYLSNFDKAKQFYFLATVIDSDASMPYLNSFFQSTWTYDGAKTHLVTRGCAEHTPTKISIPLKLIFKEAAKIFSGQPPRTKLFLMNKF